MPKSITLYKSVLAALLLCFVGTFPRTAEAQESQELMERAYQREVAYLNAERTRLSARLAELDSEQTVALGKLATEVAELDRQLSQKSLERETLQDKLADLERTSMTSEANTAVLQSTLTQGAESLNWTLPTQESAAVSFGSLVEATLGALDTERSVSVSSGAFFLEDGSQIEGEIVRFGRVASYGLAGENSGVLRPVGEGALQRTIPLSSGEVQALVDGTAKGVLPAFLYEGELKGVTLPSDRGALQVIQDGGEVAWVIAFLGLAALVMVVGRAAILGIENRRSKALLSILSSKESPTLEAIAAESHRSTGALGEVCRGLFGGDATNRDALFDRATEKLLAEQPRMERFGTALFVIAAVAPLLGLLGTVTGMIGTFEVITEHGTGDPQLLSGGISVALITTQLGLIVAIPTVLAGQWTRSRCSSLMGELELGALTLVNLLANEADKQPPAEAILEKAVG